MDARVDAFIEKHRNFSDHLIQLRDLILSTKLDETIKWGMPTYSLNSKNVVGLAAFKNHFGIWFFQGALLKDTSKVLTNAQEGKTQAMRQWRFTATSKMDKHLILKYINEAIKNERMGLKVKLERRSKPLQIPGELVLEFKKDKALDKAFKSLTPGKQKEYAVYIDEAKRPETKTKRLVKILPMINEGIGLNDKYKNC